jgi:hypothetical protein
VIVDAADIGSSPVFEKSASGDGFDYLHPVLAGNNSGVRYWVETTDTLVSNMWSGRNCTGSGASAAADGFLLVTNRIPSDVVDQRFIRLRAELE